MLDCRTRWNSLFDMLSHFVRLRSAVQKALIDVKDPAPVSLTERDFILMQEVVSALEPVKLVVQALSRRDTNLITAEVALNFCIVQLQKQSSELAKTLPDSLESRLGERRALHAGVLRYLHSATSRASATTLFSVPSNAVIKKFVHQQSI